jgi:hypothetical protein
MTVAWATGRISDVLSTLSAHMMHAIGGAMTVGYTASGRPSMPRWGQVADAGPSTYHSWYSAQRPSASKSTTQHVSYRLSTEPSGSK